ncbi:MAG: cytochrome c oxidase subunit II, partial [Proteobacteria bacterium]
MFFSEAYAMGLPKQGTDVAVIWDHLYLFLLWLSVFFFILVVGGMLYFAVKYKKTDGVKPKYIVDNHGLELFWTIIPTILLLAIFGWGWSVYKKMVQAPTNAMEIRVIGKQWLWNFQYDDGRVLTNEVYVPQNTPVKFVMSSEDVIHSFFIPNFRVKSDVVPGMYTTVWFEAKEPGENQVFCTEYCGASHSLMLAKVKVLEADKWEAFKRGKPVEVTGAAPVAQLSQMSLPEQGAKLVEAKGCNACHNSTGAAGAIGPTHK